MVQNPQFSCVFLPKHTHYNLNRTRTWPSSYLVMASLKSLFLILLVVFTTMVTADHLSSSSSLSSIKAGYWPTWDSVNFPPMAIDTSFFTHIFYAFLMPDNVTYKLVVSESESTLLTDFTNTLHQKNPPVQTLISIGGGGSDSTIFSNMSSQPSSRQSFINSTIEIARQYGFDGLDLDWETPTDPKQMNDLGLLLMEWRVAIENEASSTGLTPLLLTAAVYYSVDIVLDGLPRSYPATSITQNLDWINAMCFDYHGPWDTTSTGAHAALFDPNSNLSTSYGLNAWINAGVPTNKLVMGLPLYGRTWTLQDPQLHGIGAPAVAVGPGFNGSMSFSEVVDFNLQEGATVVYDPTTVSTYSYAGTSWIGYDDQTSITTKIDFALALDLRGYFFWSVNGDKDWTISRTASEAWGTTTMVSHVQDHGKIIDQYAET